MLNLPSDVLILICEELGNRRDFQALFHCALAGKLMVRPALMWLYRIHSLSTIISSEGNDADLSQNNTFTARLAAQTKTFKKWALQWRSIIRSSLNKTAYPYCLYIRCLDLRNFTELLDDPLFRDDIFDAFFADDMAIFLRCHETSMRQKTGKARALLRRLDTPRVIDLVGESITTFICEAATKSHTTVAVEDLSGNIRAEALPRWASRLSKLKSMTLWDGSALGIETAKAISSSCFEFDDLTFYSCLKPNADKDLAIFFANLRGNTVRSFTALNANAVGPDTLHSLSYHARSLKVLKLDGLKSDAIKNLSMLRDFDAIESLDICDCDGIINLEATENDVYLKIIEWLGSCNNLRDLSLGNMLSGPSILTQVCLKNTIQLRKLQIVSYSLANNLRFHAALSHQTTLESLELRADPEGAARDDIDTLICSVSQLTNLKYLNLLSTSDYFNTSAVISLASKLVKLEEFAFGGYDVTDDLWSAMVGLRNLHALNIHAISSFSFDGILAYVDALQDTNEGLLLAIMSQTPEKPITDGELSIIRQSLAANVGGSFDFTLFREPESDLESFSE